ncbi:DNA gyrase inhibitor YacG [Chitinibacter sp. SCUT-21]|uniref:DNA gyrase inhibitor YacG n=1 Tax=Chitinibacter sp. SCUT-21 TaxID=2970891 RepID=UPI0035A5EEF1
MIKTQQPMVKCPTCAAVCAYSPQNLFRPFCSERCKMIDLGEWANESYRIPEQNNTANTIDSIDYQ